MPDVTALWDGPALLDLAGRLAVVVAFGWAALAKLADLPLLRATLYLSRVTRPWVPQLTVLLPGLELGLAAALLGARWGGTAAAASAVLLVAFVGYLALDRSSGQGCSCFGGRTASSRRAGVLRDLLLLAALGPALVRGPAAARWGVPAAAELWALAASALVIGGAFGWAFRRDRTTDRSNRSKRPGRAPGRRRAGLAPVPPPDVRRHAVPFDVASLNGGRLTSAVPADRPRGLLIVFVEPGCALCEAVLPVLADRPDAVFLVATTDPPEVAAWAAAHRLPPGRVGLDLDGAVADAWRVPANPAAARIDPAGLLVDASGRPVARVAVGAEAVRALAVDPA